MAYASARFYTKDLTIANNERFYSLLSDLDMLFAQKCAQDAE